MSSQLSALVQVIAAGVQEIQAKCATRGVPYPATDVPLSPETDATQNELAGDAAPVLAAAYQLIATLQHPGAYLGNMTFLVRNFDVTVTLIVVH